MLRRLARVSLIIGFSALLTAAACAPALATCMPVVSVCMPISTASPCTRSACNSCSETATCGVCVAYPGHGIHEPLKRDLRRATGCDDLKVLERDRGGAKVEACGKVGWCHYDRAFGQPGEWLCPDHNPDHPMPMRFDATGEPFAY